MKKDIIILSADTNYINHAKYLISSLLLIGKWQGDICLISNAIDEKYLIPIEDKGIIVYRASSERINPFFIKFNGFISLFKQWERICTMDCDFIILKDINDIISNSEKDFIWDIEPFTIKQYLTDNNSDIYNNLKTHYDLNRKGFNSSCIIFNSNIIEFDNKTLEKLLSWKKHLSTINHHTGAPEGTDQPILNLVFYDRLSKEFCFENNSICFYKNMDKRTIAAHTCRWSAPWINPEYLSTYHQYLNLFEKMSPLK
jgi:lipopolysaccharide biosynthesis glycosyltransferase